MNIEDLYQVYLEHPSVQTDTRKLKEGDLFFALKGPNFNANSFATQALEQGAAGAVIDDPSFHISGKTILVDNVLEALQQLAKHHRLQFTIPFIAITGSNGKTTTKELVSAVLSTKYRTYTTEGNLNNHIGIPLTILRVKPDAEMAVIEMGANHQREIAGYCEYTLPTHGIITNCGKAHLEGFGGVEGVRKGKGELYDFIRQTQGAAFVMWDYEYLREMSKGIPEIITYGSHDASITGLVKQSEPYLEVSVANVPGLTQMKSQLVGEYNLPNILVAVTVGRHFNIEGTAIQAAIESYAPSNSRSQLIVSGSNRIILDAYNANPSSMRLAIENIAALTALSKLVLLGAMAELGEDSLDEHQAIINLLSQHSWTAVVLVGGDFMKIPHPYLSFETAILAGEWFRQQNFTDTTILIKGSRSMQMEKVLEQPVPGHE
ncbi:MAG: UDP-N-acetylmuramoyl-tripeptide--D-alanyl-D-alanine ligase [Chitinophagaceae bacterium]|nr:UDP-N-acetylmuramoyl-tripeptide--D-alanyl-D-alanine ligase [Chitinophagaceae bacterium]